MLLTHEELGHVALTLTALLPPGKAFALVLISSGDASTTEPCQVAGNIDIADQTRLFAAAIEALREPGQQSVEVVRRQ